MEKELVARQLKPAEEPGDPFSQEKKELSSPSWKKRHAGLDHAEIRLDQGSRPGSPWRRSEAARRSRRSPPTPPSFDPAEPVEAPAPGECQQAFRAGQEKQGQEGRGKRPREPSCFSRSATNRSSWSDSKRLSTALMPVIFPDLSMSNILI